MNKSILVVSECTKRSNAPGLTNGLVTILKRIKEPSCKICVFNRVISHNNKSTDYSECDYYYIDSPFFLFFLLRLPFISSYLRAWIVTKRLRQILKKQRFDLIIIDQIPYYSYQLVRIAHAYGVKVLLRPWGSDVLRLDRVSENLRKTYNIADYIGGDPESNVMRNAQEIYNVPDNKIINLLSNFKNVKRILDLKGKYSREYMSERLSIPVSKINIVCGYNMGEGQRHRLMIEQLHSIKDYLPSDYQLIFPVSYGWNHNPQKYKETLKHLCKQYGLNAYFIENYISAELMDFLHLITDYFITIQPTDNGSSFLIEALMCGNQVITGRWLNYLQFEKFGLPYYLCDSPNDLGKVFKDIITNAIPQVYPSQELVNDFIGRTSVPVEDRWSSFLATI